MNPIHTRNARSISLPTTKGQVLGPESNSWWWHPSRPGVRHGPDWFMATLKAIDPDLQVTWNAYRERWQVWAPRPTLRNPVCQGWLLLFPVQLPDGSYAPLDERTLAKVYEVSSRVWGNAKSYFNRIEAEMARDKALAESSRADNVKHAAGEYFDYTQPKVSMFGPSNGSKCSDLTSDLV